MTLKNKTIGILGGGQLGKMTAIAAKKLGYNLVDHKLELYGSKIKK